MHAWVVERLNIYRSPFANVEIVKPESGEFRSCYVLAGFVFVLRQEEDELMSGTEAWRLPLKIAMPGVRRFATVQINLGHLGLATGHIGQF